MKSKLALATLSALLLLFTACGDSKSKEIRAQSEGTIHFQKELFVEFDEKFTQKNSLESFVSQNDGLIKAKVNGKETDIKARVI